MRLKMTRLALAAAVLSLAPVGAAQSQRYFDTVVRGAPEKTRLPARGDHLGDVWRWQVRERSSPYNGLTLVWAVIDDDDVLLSVDGKPRFEQFGASGVADDAIAVVSGGMWTGRYDTTPNARKPAGLVVSDGATVAPFVALTTGAILIACGDDVDIEPVRQFAEKFLPRSTTSTQPSLRLPCTRASMLQTNLMLVKNGIVDRVAQDTPSNRLAIGIGDGKLVIAGAFIPSGFALSAADFAQFIVSAAKQTSVSRPTVLNLDGACAAQLSFPKARLRFGCTSVTYTINRIILRPEP